MTLTPAYGRDYRSKAQVSEAFYSNQDFRIASIGSWMGAYVSCQELKGKETQVSIRYDKQRKVTVLPVK